MNVGVYRDVPDILFIGWSLQVLVRTSDHNCVLDYIYYCSHCCCSARGGTLSLCGGLSDSVTCWAILVMSFSNTIRVCHTSLVSNERLDLFNFLFERLDRILVIHLPTHTHKVILCDCNASLIFYVYAVKMTITIAKTTKY